METAAAIATGSTMRRWGASFWATLAIIVLNFTFLLFWPRLTMWLDMRIAWAWRYVPYCVFEGWTLGSVVLLGLWLTFGASRTRWIIVPALGAAGILVSIGALHDTIFRRGLFWGYWLPQWQFLCLMMALPLAGLHLFLHPLRVLLGWRLSFAASRESLAARGRFQFRLRDLLLLTAGIAVALAAIRGAYMILAHTSSTDLLGSGIYRLLCFGQILIPALACAWLIVGCRKQWIGGLVLALALACPWFLVQTSWYTYLSTVPSQLWLAHWMNLGAAACVALNLVPLRLCGLRLITKRSAPASLYAALPREYD